MVCRRRRQMMMIMIPICHGGPVILTTITQPISQNSSALMRGRSSQTQELMIICVGTLGLNDLRSFVKLPEHFLLNVFSNNPNV